MGSCHLISLPVVQGDIAEPGQLLCPVCRRLYDASHGAGTAVGSLKGFMEIEEASAFRQKLDPLAIGGSHILQHGLILWRTVPDIPLPVKWL